MSGPAGGMLGIVRRDLTLYSSLRLRPLSQAALAILGVTLFYYVSRLVGGRRFATPDEYFAFVVVGLAALHLLTATLATVPGALQTEILGGTFERLAVSATGPAACIVAMTLFPAAVALVAGVVTIAFAALVFGLPLAGAQALLAVPAALLALLSFLPFALLVAALVLVAKQVGSLAGLLVVAVSLAGGVYYPPQLLPPALEWLAYVQPFTPALDLLRHLLVDAEPVRAPALDAARLAGFAVLGGPVAWLALRAAIDRCRRRGTLLEY